ncbi:MAG: shikimate dehydrogenase family protein [Ferruginibacter sp.]
MDRVRALYGLIGFPLEHSFSKHYFDLLFQQENLTDHAFELFALQTIDSVRALSRQHPALKGLAVTIPYKEAIIPFLDEITEPARTIGAVNCIRIDSSDRWVGYNTDQVGFLTSIQPLLKPHHRSALILGTGGVSKTIQWVFRQLGIAFETVSRDQDRSSTGLTYASLDVTQIKNNQVIVNATPLGTVPNVDEYPPIPYEALGPQHLLVDVVYNPERTVFLQKGVAAGAMVKNGYDMLLHQAAENWNIWHT